MDSERLPRKLAAILYADVAGYSRLTGEDEEGTHRQLGACLDLIAENIKSPALSLHLYAKSLLFRDPMVTETFIEHLRNAGLPD